MTDPYEVIAAFADGERVEADALRQALGEPAGRDYLIDLLALGDVVQASEPGRLAVRRARSPRLRWLPAAAALFFVIAGGWFLTMRATDRPPTPDRIVKLERGLDWRGN
jgi:hypothetical protein